MRKILSVLPLLFILISCQKDFLNRKPLDQYSDDAVWSSLPLMKEFVNNIYSGIAHSDDRPMLGIFTDELQFNPGSDNGESNVTKSLITPSNLISFAHWGSLAARTWPRIYIKIRACNLFLEKAGENTFKGQDLDMKNALTGEIYFLRAYYYHELAFIYGGVPIIKDVYGLSDSFNIARNTFQETIQFIVDDCDSAAAILPVAQTGSNFGRATKGAALALKSRVLLYAASDLYHDPSWTGGYSNYELVGYAGGGDRASYWTKAKDAAKAVIDMGIYSLYKGNPSPGDNISRDYAEIFTSQTTNEDIFIKMYDKANANYMLLYNLSNGYHGWINHCSTGQFVDDFDMKDGSKFDWNNPVMRAHPYDNRDPRFYADIFFTGATWRPRPSDLAPSDPIGIWNSSYQQQSDGSWRPGLDARESSASSWEGSYTGYSLRKFLDSTVNGPVDVQICSWRYIRYAEVLLNYAEACSELGLDDEARTYVNMIRTRVDLPGVTTSGNALLESIRHERKIELMGEDQRFFDIRRWEIAPQVMDEDVMGIDIRYYKNQNIPVYKIIDVGERSWNNRFYFLPITLDEMNRNNLLIQNPLY